MKYISTPLITVLVGLFASCHDRETRLTIEEQASIVREIQKTLVDYHAAVEARGLTAEFDFLDSSPEFFWVPPGSVTSLSYDSIHKVLSQNAPRFGSIDSEWDTLRVIPLTRELAMYTGLFRSTSIDTSGVASSVRLVETGLMTKRKEGWKLLSGQTAVVVE